MWLLILNKAKKFLAPIVAILAAIAAIFALMRASKKVGVSQAKSEAVEKRAADYEAIAVREVNEARASAAAESNTLKESIDVQSNNAALSDDAVANKLRDEWSRD